MKGNHQKVSYRQIHEHYILNKSKDKSHHAGRTARALGISRRTVQRAIRYHGVPPEHPEKIYRIKSHPSVKQRAGGYTSDDEPKDSTLKTDEYEGGLFRWTWT